MRWRTCVGGVVAGLVVGVWVVPPVPAGADPNLLTFTVDAVEASPGEDVTVTVTFTNPEDVDVVFSYMSIYPTWPTMVGDVKYAITSCTGEVSSCWMLYASFDRGAAMHHNVVIPAGATRTATLVYRVLPNSPCGDGRAVDLVMYTYRESSAGAFDEVVAGPQTDIVC